MPDPTSIALHQLTVGYKLRHGQRRTVCDKPLNATASAGTLTCIIGRNGAGKSTLLRTMARLQPQLEGSVSIGGRDTRTLSRKEFAHLASVVLTARPDTTDLTVGELAALGRTPYTDFWGRLDAADTDAANRALRLVGMEDMARRRVCRLSDGECQKAMIAKSLAQDTPVILLDEPTAFLDFPGKVELMVLLRRLAHDEGKTIILSTHDLETALQTADRMWLFDSDGISEGSPLSLVQNGCITRYIGREDVKLDQKDMSLKIIKTAL